MQQGGGGHSGIDNRTRGKIPLENAREARGYVSSRGENGGRGREQGRAEGSARRREKEIGVCVCRGREGKRNSRLSEGVESNSIKFEVVARLPGCPSLPLGRTGQRVLGEISRST